MMDWKTKMRATNIQQPDGCWHWVNSCDGTHGFVDQAEADAAITTLQADLAAAVERAEKAEGQATQAAAEHARLISAAADAMRIDPWCLGYVGWLKHVDEAISSLSSTPARPKVDA